jgi:serine/threonine protein kinase
VCVEAHAANGGGGWFAGNLKEAIRNGNLQRGGTACALDVALLALDVAKGCQAIHKYNIIHGDLKPHNVLLTTAPDDERGWIGKIADFGLSVKIKRGEQHVSGIQHGTEGYVAPEVLQTRRMVKASDVYSFGIIMWELWHARLYYEEHRNAVKRMCVSSPWSLGAANGARDWFSRRKKILKIPVSKSKTAAPPFPRSGCLALLIRWHRASADALCASYSHQHVCAAGGGPTLSSDRRLNVAAPRNG